MDLQRGGEEAEVMSSGYKESSARRAGYRPILEDSPLSLMEMPHSRYSQTMLPVYSWIVSLFTFLRPVSAHHRLQSKYPDIKPVIEQCRLNWSHPGSSCVDMLQCVIDGSPSLYATRWSAGASILAFIPTIVGLMSNSIDEITAIAEESTLLAIAISLSSVTVFSSRLGDKLTSAKPGDYDAGPQYVQAMQDNISESIKENRREHPLNWQGGARLQDAIIGVIMIGCSSLIWWQLYLVTKYGVVSFACPRKLNVMLWAALGQALTLANVFLRHRLFDCRKVNLRTSSGFGQTSPTEPALNVADSERLLEHVVLVFRCPRVTFLRRTLQFCTAVLSFGIYTYGTVILASMTMYEAKDALFVVIVVSVNAGFGRLVGYWAISPSMRSGKKALIFDIPAIYMDRMVAAVSEGV